MATTANSHMSSNAAPVPFSYAQAAKGQPVSKPASSGAATPANDSQSINSSAAAVMSWAEDAEANDPRSEKPSTTRESRILHQKSTASNELTAAALSSPEMGASTASTVTKDDDVSSVPNTSSDSTWENKSQASTSIEKATEPSEKSSQKGKGKKREQPPVKPLQEAPLPMVNIWQQRAELRQKPGKPASTASLPNGNSSGNKQTKDAEKADLKDNAAPAETKPRAVDGEKGDAARHDSKSEIDADKTKKSTRGRPHEKDTKPTPVFSLPPERDQESWPTMDAAIDEDRKKAQEKAEKPVQERKDSLRGKAGGKVPWVKVDFVPSVNFNTPLPSTGARRGGRNAARGGAQNGGRPGGFGANGPEKDTSSPAIANGDQSRRGRPDAPLSETPNGNRNASTGSLTNKDKPTHVNGEKSGKPVQADGDGQARGGAAETQNNISGQHNTFPRQYSNRPKGGRRGDWAGSDRRKDGDSSSPTKENGMSNSSTQTDVPEDTERRNNYPEGQGPHQSKRGSSDRFGGFNGRERRGGGRGGRGGNFSNGHQFTNGHMSSMKQSSNFGPMSPTTFNPEQTPYYPQGRFRNGPRSQSVTNDSMYRMNGQYSGPQQMPPINTYMGGNGFDYPMMPHPMSAAPFGQFGVDHFTLLAMVTTQVEYYFSLDNLCKDMFLRKHMDSKGFVFLNVIAEFNRIKQLTTDLELIKHVCYNSQAIEFRIGQDGKDRLRARENWQQWVLPTEERDISAQTEGPAELYNPPIPHPTNLPPNGNSRHSDMAGVSSPAPGAYSTEGAYPTTNGFHPGAASHTTANAAEIVTNDVAAEHVNDNALPNGHPIEEPAKAVSADPDSFSDEQIQSLVVIVRKQYDPQMQIWPPCMQFDLLNPHSRNDGVIERGESVGNRVMPESNGAVILARIKREAESQAEQHFWRSLNLSIPTSPLGPRYWVKDNDAPVNVLHPGCFHESYAVLRSKALHQRLVSSVCSYDMSVLYQFWSHFLVRSFNTRMYNEFYLFAKEDSRDKSCYFGIFHLVNFYGKSMSCQDPIRNCVARDFVDLIRRCKGNPLLQRIRWVLHNDKMNARNRLRINDFLDDEVKASLA